MSHGASLGWLRELDLVDLRSVFHYALLGYNVVFDAIVRLEEQETIEMGFLKKLKFWKKRHNVSKKYKY